MHRPIATCVIWKFMPAVKGIKLRDWHWHAPFLEVHLMGIERSMFRNDQFSDRYNQAVSIECMYKRMGMVTEFSLN
jgi:hypothetical protein